MQIGRARWVLLLGFCAGCAGTPQTDPPMVQGTDDPARGQGTPQGTKGTPPAPGLEVGQVDVRPEPVDAAVRARTLRGRAAAVTPPGAVLRVTNLDSTSDSVEVVAAVDGSFELEVEAALGHELRFQVLHAEQRSVPVDLVLAGEGLAHRERISDCWTTRPELELDFDHRSNAVLEVVNECKEPLSLARVALRTDQSGYAVTEAPELVPIAATAAIRLGFAAADPRAAEGVLLIEVSAPAPERRAITLIGGMNGSATGGKSND